MPGCYCQCCCCHYEICQSGNLVVVAVAVAVAAAAAAAAAADAAVHASAAPCCHHPAAGSLPHPERGVLGRKPAREPEKSAAAARASCCCRLCHCRCCCQTGVGSERQACSRTRWEPNRPLWWAAGVQGMGSCPAPPGEYVVCDSDVPNRASVISQLERTAARRFDSATGFGNDRLADSHG